MFQILLVKEAKEKGLPVTCEVCPHHLFLNYEEWSDSLNDTMNVKPPLASLEDQTALWENMDVIDCFATDHGRYVYNLIRLKGLSM